MLQNIKIGRNKLFRRISIQFLHFLILFYCNVKVNSLLKEESEWREKQTRVGEDYYVLFYSYIHEAGLLYHIM